MQEHVPLPLSCRLACCWPRRLVPRGHRSVKQGHSTCRCATPAALTQPGCNTVAAVPRCAAARKGLWSVIVIFSCVAGRAGVWQRVRLRARAR